MLLLTIVLSVLLHPPVPFPLQPVCATGPLVPTEVEAPAVAAFARRVDEYMQLHDRAEGQLALNWQFEDPEEMEEAMAAIQAAIRSARPGARRGSIFTDDVGEIIRSRLRAQLAACNQKVEDVLAFINGERMPRARRPEINEPFPWELGSAMWPSILPVLPRLPDELQYRFADRDLVLIDAHAGLVVDILMHALPPRTARGS